MNSFWQDEPAIMEILVKVQDLIRESIEPASPYIRSILMEITENRGKMLRPAMIYIASLLNEGSEDEKKLVLQIASAMEMLHMASLIHDDIIDESAMRRGKPTLQIKAGVKKAVVAGDYLLTRAFSLLTVKSETISPDVVQNSVCRLCDSEIDQDSELWDFSVKESHYYRRIAGKTASLFSLSLYLGAAAVNADSTKQCLMRKLGYCIGMAFQIQDDILDYAGSAATLGKPAGNDLRCGVATLPLIHAVNHDSTGNLTKMLSGRSKISKRVFKRVTSSISESESLKYAESIAQKYWDRVKNILQILPEGESRRLLTLVCEKLETRAS